MKHGSLMAQSDFSPPRTNASAFRASALLPSKTLPTRREFLCCTAATLAQKSSATPDDAGGEWRNKQPGMAYRKLGRTGFYLSEIVMGGNTIAPDNYKHVLAALDRGLNYLDTAPGYGEGKSEEGYAQVLKERPRDQFFLNTKISIWDTNRAQIYRSIYDGLPGAEQDRLRSKMLDDIEEKDLVEFRDVHGEFALVNIPFPELEPRITRSRDVLIDPDHARGLGKHLLGDIALTASDIEHRGASAHRILGRCD